MEGVLLLGCRLGGVGVWFLEILDACDDCVYLAETHGHELRPGSDTIGNAVVAEDTLTSLWSCLCYYEQFPKGKGLYGVS